MGSQTPTYTGNTHRSRYSQPTASPQTPSGLLSSPFRPPVGLPFSRSLPPPGNPFLRPGPPTGNPFLRPRPPSGLPLLPTRFCPPVGRHRMSPSGCLVSPHHPPTATSRPYPHDNSFPPFPQSILKGISMERVPTSIPVTTQPPQTLKSVTSFLLNSTRWNCTPAMAILDGMLTVS